MIDYNDYKDFKQIITNNIDDQDENVKIAVEIFATARNLFKYKEKYLSDRTNKIDNVMQLSIYNLFLVNELLSNIAINNYISCFSLIRIIIENINILYFLKNSNDEINNIYYDYNKLRFINIWDDQKIKEYEDKYSLKINKNKDKQWIEQAFKQKNKGYNYIKKCNKNKGFDFFDGWYKSNCNFIHSSISASQLNTSLFLDDQKKYKGFINDFLYFIMRDCHNVFCINQDYLDYDENLEKLLQVIDGFEKECD